MKKIIFIIVCLIALPTKAEQDDKSNALRQEIFKRHKQSLTCTLDITIPEKKPLVTGDGFLYIKIAQLPAIDITLKRELGVVALFLGFYWFRSFWFGMGGLGDAESSKPIIGQQSPSEFHYEIIGRRLGDNE